jgi:hypothetical protein
VISAVFDGKQDIDIGIGIGAGTGGPGAWDGMDGVGWAGAFGLELELSYECGYES